MPSTRGGGKPAREPWDVTSHAIPGRRFVTPEEFREVAPMLVEPSMVKDVVVRALADAADADGELLGLDLDYPGFFERHVAGALRADPQDAVTIGYDRFSALVLTECVTGLTIRDGLLANRGNGGSADFRLVLPTSTPG